MKRAVLTIGLVGAVGLALGAGCGSDPGDSLMGTHIGPTGGGGTAGGGGGSGGGVNGGINNGGGTTSGGGVGGGDSGGGGGPPVSGPQGYFEATVYPSLSQSPGLDANGNAIPSCATCHASGALGAPAFLAGANAAGAYATITGTQFISLITVPANSMLILHGQHEGPALTAAQTTIVGNWLGQEVVARGINPSPAKTVQGELTKIGKCMSLTDFTKQQSLNGNTAAAADIWQRTARYQGNDDQCYTCHNVGDGGFAANPDAQTMLTTTQSDITFIKKYFTGTVDANGNFNGLTGSSAVRNLVALSQNCQIQGLCHPSVNLNPAPGQSVTLYAIDQFVSTTLARYNAGQCP